MSTIFLSTSKHWKFQMDNGQTLRGPGAFWPWVFPSIIWCNFQSYNLLCLSLFHVDHHSSPCGHLNKQKIAKHVHNFL